MKTGRTPLLRRAASRQSGFTLLNVLAASLIFGFGVLGIVRSLANITSAATQNTNVSVLGSLSDGFQAVMQANSAVLVDPMFAAPQTFTQANYAAAAPVALRPWLAQTTTALPSANVTIGMGPDPVSTLPCSRYNGCAVTLTIQWTQVGLTAPRTQTFLYRFGQ